MTVIHHPGIYKDVYSQLLPWHGVAQNTITVEPLIFVDTKFRVCRKRYILVGT